MHVLVGAGVGSGATGELVTQGTVSVAVLVSVSVSVEPPGPLVLVQSPLDGGAMAHWHTLEAPAMTDGMAAGGQAVATQGTRSAERLRCAAGWHWQR